MFRVDAKYLFKKRNKEKQLLNKLLESVRQRVREIARNNRIASQGARFDTSDIVQEALIQIWQDLDSDSSKSEDISRAWLVSVAKGHAYKLARFHSAKKRSHDREDKVDTNQMPTALENPDDKIAEQELQLRALVALDDLPADEKDVIVLYIVEQQSLVAISDTLGLSVDQVRTRRDRALKTLHRVLKLRDEDG